MVNVRLKLYEKNTQKSLGICTILIGKQHKIVLLGFLPAPAPTWGQKAFGSSSASLAVSNRKESFEAFLNKKKYLSQGLMHWDCPHNSSEKALKVAYNRSSLLKNRFQSSKKFNKIPANKQV